MNDQFQDPVIRSAEYGARCLSVLTILMGCAVLAGWMFDLPYLNGPGPGASKTLPNTAAGFMLAGLALRLLQTGYSRFGRITATAVCLIGLLTLSEYFFGVDLGIDRALFEVPPEPGRTVFAGRMSQACAFNLLLAGVSLLSLGVGRIGANAGQHLAVLLFFSGWFFLIGHVYDPQALRAFTAPFKPMSLYSALTFCALALGLLLAFPERGWMSVLLSDKLGGLTARRLLPVVITVPLLLGWLRLQGQYAGFYGTEIGLTLVTIANTVIFSLVIFRHAQLMNRTDAQRASTDTALRAKEEQYRTLIENMPDVVWTSDRLGHVAFISPGVRKICGYDPGEIRDEGAHPHFGIIHPGDLDRVKDAYEALFRREQRFDVEYRIRAKDGGWHWIHDRAIITYQRDGVRYADGLFVDITTRKEMEKALSENRVRLAKAQRIAQLGHWDWDLVAGTLIWSEELYTMFGVDPEQFEPSFEAALTRIHPADRDQLKRDIEGTLRSGDPYGNEHRIVRADGTERIVYCQGEVSFDDTGLAVRLFGTVQDITERVRNEEALRESEARFRWIFECGMLGMGYWQASGEITDANEALLRIVGYTREDLVAGRLDWRKLTPPESIQRDELALKEITERGVLTPFEKEYIHNDGHRIPVLVGAATHAVTRDRGVFFVVDLTERKKAEAQLRKLSLAVEHSPSAVVITDRDAVIEYANPKFYWLTGYAPDEVIGQTPRILRSGLTPMSTYKELWTTILSGEEWHGEFHDRRKNGEIYWCLQSISPVKNEQGEITHFVSVTEDISERKQSQDLIRHLAYYDPLTDLPNRILFRDRFEQAISGVSRSGQMCALAYLDLDRFKNINDSLGHPVGDQLLKHVAQRIKHCLRESDTVARLGGDEFAVILQGLRHVEDTGRTLEQMMEIFKRPFVVEGHQLFVTSSIGISLCPNDGADADLLIKSADLALYRAKESGRNNFCFFTQEMQAETTERLSLESDLRLALERDELALYYQPQVCLRTGAIVGMEALLRWQHPERGAIPPDRFIPVAEDSGLIIPIGEWVLRTACAQCRTWRNAFGREWVMAVNLSARHLRDSGFVSMLERVLEETGCEAHYLELELTESIIMHDVEAVLGLLYKLKAVGVRLSIDDFGTGYSSLGYLKRLPVDKIKIDKSFIGNLPADPDEAAIACSVIALGHNMKLTVIAEGVEKDEQLTFLRDHQCDEIQGYYFSHPVDTAAFTELLRENKGLDLPQV